MVPPRIELGSQEPKSCMLPLHHGTFLYYFYFPLLIPLVPFFIFLFYSPMCSPLKKGHNRIRTNDHGNCSPMLYHWAMRPPIYPYVFPFPCFILLSLSFKKTPPVGLEPTTLRLKAARSTDWARKAPIILPVFPISFLYPFSFYYKRASPGIEPGPPAPKAGILPLNYKAFYSFFVPLLSSPHVPSLFYTYIPRVRLYSPKKGGFGGNRTRATCTLSRYFTT